MKFNSKLPNVSTTIFTVMSQLANEHGAINLSQGFPNFDTSENLKKLVNHYITSGKNQYAPMPGVLALREQLSSKIETLYGLQVDPNSEITITAGATQALYTAISAFVKPDDEVVLIEPAYDSYRPSIKVNGGIPKAYELSGPDYKIDWNQLRKLVSVRTRMIIINTPHNPIGKILSEEDMKSLDRLTEGTDILVLSDEVYEHLVYDGLQHQSVLRFPNLWKRSMAVFSFGKTLHATGWKLGYIVAPDYIMAEFRKVHQFNVFSVNTPMQYAIADFLVDPNEYLSLPSFFQKKRDFFLEAMKGSSLKPISSEGTYFQLFDYSAISSEKDTEFTKRMTTEFGVAAIPVSVFFSNNNDNQVVRLCFAKTEDTLSKAGELLQKI
ncbi:MAG: methionine aminotransferase [Bacteroidetes bacterium]|jgi:methionine aminotransferase|nr:methionine aminotransferase [Bacteroidota bacterium]MDF1865683.1 methionine aminotransferase [Saprospiraceae bacterium]